MKLSIIGVGPGEQALLTSAAQTAIQQADKVFATQRLYQVFSSLNPNTQEIELRMLKQAICQEKAENIAVLCSGDVGFYSVSSMLTRDFPQAEADWYSGISSLQALCSRLRVPYEGLKTVSLHGREQSLVPYVCYHPRVFALTGGKNRADQVIEELCQAGLGFIRVTVGENLFSPQERLLTGTAQELQGIPFENLAVMLAENPQAVNPHEALSDSRFLRGKVPMTKEEVRAVSLSKLDVHPGDCCYDIGAGTGSVSIAMARKAWEGRVWAIEKEPDALELIRQNRQILGAYNLTPIQASAPEGIDSLPPADKVFIGGSGGSLNAILSLCLKKNPNTRFVVNAITLETLQLALKSLEELGCRTQVVCLNCAYGEKVGPYHMMKAQNPVYIITGEPK